jgi:allophanate hydrolase
VPVALEVAAPGLLSSLQDLGRPGFRRFGVPASGALDPRALRLANALCGNPEGEAAVEFFHLGPTLRARGGRVRLGLVGDLPAAAIEGPAGERPAAPWRSLTLADGEALRVGPVRPGRAGYLAVQGGLLAEVVMGSASTCLRAGFGGAGGAPLRKGQVLALRAGPPPAGPERVLPAPPAREEGPIRAVPGPQDDAFPAEALATFFSAEWRVTAQSDRMGSRLEGPRLAHRPEAGAEIVSDATVPGSIQVPGNGLPIVLLADGQTTGGYPKIATVCSADLPRLAHLGPGAPLRFAAVTVEEAEALARAAEARLRRLIGALAP